MKDQIAMIEATFNWLEARAAESSSSAERAELLARLRQLRRELERLYPETAS